MEIGLLVHTSKHFDIKQVIPAGSDVFSAEYIEEINPKDTTRTLDGRVMTGPTSWEVLVLYKDCNTETKIDGIMKLHLMFGHKSNKYIKEAIKDDPTLRTFVERPKRP